MYKRLILPVLLHEYEAWLVPLTDEHTLRTLDVMVLRIFAFKA
jgi:hypothetical protein